MPVKGATAIARGGAGENESTNTGGRTAAAASSLPTAGRLTDSLISAAALRISCFVLMPRRAARAERGEDVSSSDNLCRDDATTS